MGNKESCQDTSKALVPVKRFVNSASGKKVAAITVVEVLKGDKVLCTLLVVGDLTDTYTSGETLLTKIQKNVLGKEQIRLQVRSLRNIPAEWTYGGSGMNVGKILSWASEHNMLCVVNMKDVRVRANSLTNGDSKHQLKSGSSTLNKVIDADTSIMFRKLVDDWHYVKHGSGNHDTAHVAPAVAEDYIGIDKLFGDLDTSAQVVKDVYGSKDLHVHVGPTTDVEWIDKKDSMHTPGPGLVQPKRKDKEKVSTCKLHVHVFKTLQTLIFASLFYSGSARGSNVTLNSTLNAELTAYPQDVVVFTCITRGTGILNWSSNEYIGNNGLLLQILSVGNTTTVQSYLVPNTSATRISITNDTGEIVIVSELRIIASLDYPTAIVTCNQNSINFSTIDRPPETTGTIKVEVASEPTTMGGDDITTKNIQSGSTKVQGGAIAAAVVGAVLVILFVIIIIIMAITILWKCKKKVYP